MPRQPLLFKLAGRMSWAAVRAAAPVLRGTAVTWPRPALTLVACGGATLFVGLAQMTLTQLRPEGLLLPVVQVLRAGLPGAAALWSLGLAWCLARQTRLPRWRRATATAPLLMPSGLVNLSWWIHFHGA